MRAETTARGPGPLVLAATSLLWLLGSCYGSRGPASEAAAGADGDDALAGAAAGAGAPAQADGEPMSDADGAGDSSAAGDPAAADDPSAPAPQPRPVMPVPDPAIEPPPDPDPASTLPDATSPDSDAFVAECIDTVTRIYPTGDPEAGVCMCGACAVELAECFRDPQCFAIFDCATRVGCFGTACYAPDTCMVPIDAAGLSSPSVATVMAVGSCSDANGCPRAPPLPPPTSP